MEWTPGTLPGQAFDLVITDVDMPRMDGIELVTLLKKDPNLKSLPVMIVFLQRSR